MSTAPDTAADEASLLRGPKVLLMGDSGTGKTYSIGTLVDWAARHGKEVFVLFTDQGLETLMGYWKDAGREVPENLHWMEVIPQPLKPTELLDMAEKVGTLSYDSLTKTTKTPNKDNAHVKIIRALINFKDDRTGKEYGDVLTWGLDRIFVIDNLTEVAEAIVKMTIGARPTMAPPDYGVGQNNLMNFIRTYATGIYTFVLICHLSREKNELTGGVQLMPKAIGTAISQDIPKPFSDAIMTVREGASWFWDTAAGNAATKTRNLAYAGKLKPDFGAIMDKWVSRGGR